MYQYHTQRRQEHPMFLSLSGENRKRLSRSRMGKNRNIRREISQMEKGRR